MHDCSSPDEIEDDILNLSCGSSDRIYNFSGECLISQRSAFTHTVYADTKQRLQRRPSDDRITAFEERFLQRSETSWKLFTPH